MSGPTLIVSLGAFGQNVLDRLHQAGVDQGARVRDRCVLLPLAIDEAVDGHVATVVARAESLLGFNAAVQADPGDERRPTLDVFIVGSFGDEHVPDRLVDLSRELSKRLLSRFSNIFVGHDLLNLTVCPVVALLGLRGGGVVTHSKKALADLEQVAESVSYRRGDASPVARVFVVEQQASRYELTDSEVASTVVAFLSLVVGSDLRQQEPLRSFLRSTVEHVRDKRLFASFGCATLEMSLHRYCTARAAAELVDAMRRAAAAGVAEHAVFAERLVPRPKSFIEALASPKGGEDLVAALRAHTPHVEFPQVGERDTPEQIRNISYGWGWFDSLETAVQAQVKRLDEHEMDEVTRVADERGLERVRGLRRDVENAIRKAENAGPHGWANALRLAENVRDRARRLSSDLDQELKDEKLPAFPEPTAVESSFRQLRDESTLRPRPYRMAFFAALASIAIGALLHHIPKWLVVCIFTRSLSPFALSPSSMDARVGVFRYLLDPPYAFFWMTLVAGVAIGLAMVRHWRRRHRELLGARDSLKASVRRYLTDDVGPSIRRYYESRLAFSLRAWALRALHRVHDLAAGEVVRLSGISAALDRLSREFRAEARRAELAAESDGGDLVYRTRLSPALLERTYEAARPGADLADTLFAKMDDTETDIPPYLFEAKIREVVEPVTLPSTATMAELAGPTVVEFVERRHARLGVPLEVRSMDPRTAEARYLFAPPWATEALDALREKHPTLPAMHELDDNDRVHLVAVQTALRRESIVLPEVDAT